MDDKRDNFSWARKLGFPPSASTDSNLLNKGIIGLLWDDSSKLLDHPKDVMVARKNILLYKLKNNFEDPRINYIKNTDRLKTERTNLNDRIKVVEEKYKAQELKIIKKENQLRLIKHHKEAPKLKKESLRMKTEQIQEILKDSKTMLDICSHLMPATNTNVSLKEMRECLDLMSNVRSGTNRKQIIKKISQTLGSIHIPTLWSFLLENQSQDMETLIKLGKKEMTGFKNTIGEDIDIGLAKARGEHIKLVCMQLLEIAKTSQNEKILMDWIEKIEMAEPDVNEWLEFALEVRMYEVEQNELQKEADQILSSILDGDKSESELAELSSRLECLSSMKQNLIEDVQKSLGFLKEVRYLLIETREKQLVNLQTIAILRSDILDANFHQWQNIDLTTELEIFYRDLDMEALRQITLKKEIVEQRYLKNSFNQAWINLSGKVSYKLTNYFLALKIPFRFLLECYKALFANALLKRIIRSESHELPKDISQFNILKREVEEELPDLCPQSDAPRLESIVESTINLLHSVDLTCKKSKEHVNEFERLFDMWSRQSIESAFTVLDETTVDGATLKEWKRLYSVVMYMLKKSSKVSLSFQPYNFDDR